MYLNELRTLSIWTATGLTVTLDVFKCIMKLRLRIDQGD